MGQKVPVRMKGQGFFAADGAKLDCQLRRRPPRSLVKIPDRTAEIVLKSVSEQDTEHVFSGLQTGGEIIGVEVHPVVGIADVGGEAALGYFPTVDP